jgi:glucose-6-phosphate 1-epimerase
VPNSPASHPSLPASVQVDVDAAGLEFVRVTGKNASAEIYLRGAHVTSWIPTGAPEAGTTTTGPTPISGEADEPAPNGTTPGENSVIWMSAESKFAPGVPLRGGVPICFPWFGANAEDPSAASHGFARLADWELLWARVEDEDVLVSFRLKDTLDTRSSPWAHQFEAIYTVTVGRRLGLALSVNNRDRKPFTYEEALHTYLAVSDIHLTSVSGLENASFIDKVADNAQVDASGEALRFAGETDRIYLTGPETITVDDPAAGRSLAVVGAGSGTTVVWNPWVDKAAQMGDFGDSEWTSMVCVETSNVKASAVTLEPGETHTMSVSYEVLPAQ